LVNILDSSVAEEAQRRLSKYDDLLRAVWSELEKLSHMYSSNTESKLWIRVNPNTREGQEVLKWTIFCCVEELFELANALKNRPWVKSEYVVDVNRLYDELADAMLFILLLAHQLGLNPDSLADVLMRKVVVNEFRIRSKY